MLKIISIGLLILTFSADCKMKAKDDTVTLAVLMALYNLSTSPTNNLSASLTYKIVDTNQTTCYTSSSGAVATCAKTGFDADYSGNQANYTKSTNGKIITDNVTGLLWIQATDTNGDGSVNVSDKKSQADAKTYCSGLTTGGYTWRLPDVKTLYSLIQFSGKDPSGTTGCSVAGSTACVTSNLTPFINTTFFEIGFGDVNANDRVIDGQYATTTNYVSTTMSGDATMFGVNFIDGRIKGYPITKAGNIANTFYVRCVSGNTNYGVNNFTDNGNNTISDGATGLMWQSKDIESTDFDNAVATCESAATANYTDWRLPNVKELQSIVDYTRSPDTTSSAAIDSKFTATAITNENNKTDYGYYWASTTHIDNDTSKGQAGTYLSFGRAVGYMTANYYDVHGSGAQRSNNKTNVSTTVGASNFNLGSGIFYYKGPQGDILRQNNKVRCVRN